MAHAHDNSDAENVHKGPLSTGLAPPCGNRPRPARRPCRQRRAGCSTLRPHEFRGGTMAAVPVTAEIARRAAVLAWNDLPDDLVERTKQCLLDWFAVTVPGAQEELTDILVREALEDGAKGQASLVGRNEKVLPSTATLINGAASHALDYDDVNFSMGGHPTVTVVPALLALGEQTKGAGRLCIESSVGGYETPGRVGRLASPSHYRRGFHVTGTVGSFAAT